MGGLGLGSGTPIPDPNPVAFTMLTLGGARLGRSSLGGIRYAAPGTAPPHKLDGASRMQPAGGAHTLVT